MWDYLECFIVIMMDVFVDLVYGKVVFFNIYYLLKFMKMLIDIIDIFKSVLIWVILLILVIDVV